jgi:hypothetical protein
VTEKARPKGLINYLPPDYADQVLESTGILLNQGDQRSFRESEILSLKTSIYCVLCIQRNKLIYDSSFSVKSEKDCLDILRRMTREGKKIRVFGKKSLSRLFAKPEFNNTNNIHSLLVRLEKSDHYE